MPPSKPQKQSAQNTKSTSPEILEGNLAQGAEKQPLTDERKRVEQESSRERAEKLALPTRSEQSAEFEQTAQAEHERVLRKNPENIEFLNNLDITKPPESQKPEWNAFKANLTIILTALIKEKQRPGENLLTPEMTPFEFSALLRQRRRILSDEEKIIANLLDEMSANPQAPCSIELLKEWPATKELANDTQPAIAALGDTINEGFDAPNKQKDDPGIYDKCKEWYKRQPTLTKVGIWAGSIGAAYIIGRWLWGKVSDKATSTVTKTEEGGILDKAWSAVKIAALALVGAVTFGWLYKKSPEWFKELTKVKPLFKDLTKELKISEDTLARLQKIPYKKFMAGEDKDSLETVAKEWGMSVEETEYGRAAFGIPFTDTTFSLPFTGIKHEETTKVRETLEGASKNPEFIKRCEAYNINLESPTLALGAVFAVLNQMASEGKPLVIAQPATAEQPKQQKEQNPENNEEKDEAVVTPEKQLVMASSKTFDELKSLVRYDAPHLHKVIEKWEREGLGQTALHFPTFFQECVEATRKEDKVSIILESGRILVTNGVKFVVLTQCQTFVDAGHDIVKWIVTSDTELSDVAETYFNHTWAFMAIGGVVGLLKGNTSTATVAGKIAVVTDKSLLGRLKGIGKGALRGCLFPVEATYQEVRLGRWAIQTAKEATWKVKKLYCGPEIDTKIALERMKFYGRKYLFEDRLRTIALGGGEKNPLLARLRRPAGMVIGDIENNIRKAAEQYARAYNTVYAGEISKGARQALTWDIIVSERYKHFREAITHEAQTLDAALALEGKRLASGTRLGNFWSKLKPFLGPVGAAATIYFIETSEDKKKALAQVTLGWAGFFTGVGVTERTIGRFIKDPRYHAVVSLLGGMAGTLGFSQKLDEIVTDYFLRFPGAAAASNEALGIIEAATGKPLIRTAGKLALKGAEEIGLKSFSKFFTKKISSSFLRKISSIAAKQGLRQILPMLGIRGVVTAGLLADDATIIGILDDVLAVGMLAWMAKDIYDLVQAVRNAYAMQNIMMRRSEASIESVDIISPPSARKEWAGNKPITEEDQENTLAQFFSKFENVQMTITRTGQPGHELWSMKKGQVTKLSVFDNNGDIVASVEDSDAFKAAAHALPAAKA